MKIKTQVSIIIMCSMFSLAQNASDYFPMQTGYKWYFQSTPLDSLNSPIDSLTYFGIDSFSVISQYNGRNASFVLSKIGGMDLINQLPYLDTMFYSFEGTSGFEYFDPLFVSDLLGNIDTTLGINFFNFFSSLEGWYAYYRFAQPVNDDYRVFFKDTTITYGTSSLPVRFELIATRLPDENVNTALGNFDCKKFLLERRLSYLISLPPPLPPIVVKLFGVEENIWFALSNWKVKSYVPSTRVDLSIIGVPAFTIPGLETKIILPITNVLYQTSWPEEFSLGQNYPNPFNPVTKIKWSSEVADQQSIKIYDVLGNEITTLVDEYRNAGTYEIAFNSSTISKKLASGTYFYQLKIGANTLTKKMLLLK